MKFKFWQKNAYTNKTGECLIIIGTTIADHKTKLSVSTGEVRKSMTGWDLNWASQDR